MSRPLGGREAHPHWKVRFVLGLGIAIALSAKAVPAVAQGKKPLVPRVPGVVGQSLAAAQKILLDARYRIGDAKRIPSTTAAGTVVAQSPESDTPSPYGTLVTLTVSSGQSPIAQVDGGQQAVSPDTIVPQLFGIPVSRIGGYLEAFRLRPGVATRVAVLGADSVNRVVQQSPAAGTSIRKGGAVDYGYGAAGVEVPDLNGQTQDLATALLRQRGLRIGVVQQTIGTGGTGLIFSQKPLAHTAAFRESAVDVQILIAPTGVSVPPLVGLEESIAIARLNALGVSANPISHLHAAGGSGLVTDQTPAPGTIVAPGAAVALEITEAPMPPVEVQVPHLVGETESAARALLSSAGLVAGKRTTRESNGPAGLVLSQNPPEDSFVGPGSGVDMTISVPTALVEVPDVRRHQAATGEAMIRAVHLSLTVRDSSVGRADAGLVVRQNPVPHSRVVRDSVVTLWVGRYTPIPVWVWLLAAVAAIGGAAGIGAGAKGWRDRRTGRRWRAGLAIKPVIDPTPDSRVDRADPFADQPGIALRAHAEPDSLRITVVGSPTREES